MQHLEEGTIHAWLDGELSAAEQAQAERHVAECGDCAAAVAEARGMIAGASRIVSALDVVRGAGGGGVLPHKPAKPTAARSVWHSLRLTPTRAALAASLLVAAGALLTAKHDTADKMTPFAVASPAAEMAAPSAGPVPAASPPPTITAARDTSASSAMSPATKKLEMQQRARTAQPTVLADAKHPDSVVRRDVQAANAIAPAPALVAASAKVGAAAPPSSPGANARTPSSLAPSGFGAAGAVVADRAREPSRAALDSLDAKRPDTVRAAPESRRQFKSSTTQLSEVVTTGAIQARNALDIAGCYQIVSDSSALSSLLPDRFALLRTTSTVVPNVRAVTRDWRMDTVVTGSNWVQISNDKAQIQSTVGTKHQVVYLQLTSLGGVSGEASTPSGPRPIGVARATCRP